jgi:hypothetical protein
MRPPEPGYKYDVGDTVEVSCDHEKGGQRIGWMVPDHILWYPVTSQHVRYPQPKKSAVDEDE